MEILFIILIFAIIIGTPLVLISLPSTKGWAGEKLVAHKFKAMFPPVVTRFFASLLVKTIFIPVLDIILYIIHDVI